MRQLSTRRLFLSICGCSILVVLLLYLQGTKILERPMVTGKHFRTALRPEIFKNVTFRIQLPDVCKKGNTHSEATGIVFVVSEPQNSRRRQIIRTTWGQKKVNFLMGSAIVFLVVGGDVHKYRTQLRLESEVFSDVMLVTPNSETFTTPAKERSKNIMNAMRWAVENCSKVDFIVQVPDDTFVNPFALERFLGDILRGRVLSIDSLNADHHPTGAPSSTADANDYNDESQDQQNRYPKRFDPTTSYQLEQAPTTDQHDGTATVRGQQSDADRIYCLVWRNVTIEKSSWTSPRHDLTVSYNINPSHCSPHGHVISLRTSRTILDAFKSDHSGAIEHWPSEFYTTGFLADRAGVRHVDIERRLVFDLGEVDEYSVFVPLGSDLDALCGSLWRMTIDNEQDSGTFGLL